MGTIKKKIFGFYRQLADDDNHRYKSWEHCYSYFLSGKPDKDIACLHLAFYLASWGMYRGSSFLLWKDYLVHRDVVEKVLKKRELQDIDYSKVDEKTIDEIFDLMDWMKGWYRQNIKAVNGEKKLVNPTDTLVTKILLGTLGCIPAYDRYFISGLREAGISYSRLSKNNFKSVIGFYKKNKQSFDQASTEITKISKVKYPTMKLVDMYFWEIGAESEK